MWVNSETNWTVVNFAQAQIKIKSTFLANSGRMNEALWISGL